jgi:ribosomal protein L9
LFFTFVQSVSDPLPADLFLERFSLPRVVRLSYSTSNYSGHETLQSSSSNDSNTIIENKTKLNSSLHQPNGELFLLYRYLKDNKVYHAVNTKSVANRRKGLKIPQDFSGKF